MRLTVVVFTACVLGYSIYMNGTPIYELVSKAYQFPVVGAFWPLVCGLYWRRSTTQGAVWSIVLGMGTWVLLERTSLGEEFPAVLGGFLMAALGMFGGSMLSRSQHTQPAT